MTTSETGKEQLLVQRYRLLEIVGSGAMGKVYRAEDTTAKGVFVAVKILTRALEDMKMIKRFQREATISALLSERSIHIVKVSDYGIDERKVPFYVMELLEGESLNKIIEFHEIPLLKVLQFSRQICLAIETAHNGIFFQGEICPVIHRDLKPSNIFIVEDPQRGELIKVLDFGIAKLDQTQKDETEAFMGTPRYASPEQLQGDNLDNRSDIYSLGLIMYQMLTKKMPWDLKYDSVGEWYKAHTQILPNGFPPELEFPVELERLVLRCLAKSPGDRPQSAGEIIQQLDVIARSLYPRGKFQESYNLIADPMVNAVVGSEKISPLEQFYLNSSWPEDKPIQKIVFPSLNSYEGGIMTSLWTMLEPEDIEKRKDNIRYNQFLFQSYPHPMILWITVLYSFEHGARWLPCYLDLKTKVGKQVTQILADSTKYYLLLFNLDNPKKCQHLMKFRIMLKQKTLLKQWISVNKMIKLPNAQQSVMSKKKLKHNFEGIKNKILLEIQKSNTQELNK